MLECVALLSLIAGSEQAFAQLVPPVIRQMVDENGVDLMSGQFTLSHSDIDIGPPEASLSYSRWISSGMDGSYGYRGNTDIAIKLISTATETAGPHADVMMGGRVETFDWAGSTFTVKNGLGSTLVFDTPSQNYIYTQRDGTVIRFPPQTANEDAIGVRAISILKPDGTLTEFSNKKWASPDLPWIWNSRVQSVVNNAGYQLKLEYTDPVRTRSPTKASVLNRGAAYCDPAADSCAATSGSPSATFAWTQEQYGAPTFGTFHKLTVTDAASRQTRWTMAAGASSDLKASGPSGVKSAAASADDTTATFEVYGLGPSGSDIAAVTSVTRRGMTWDYQVLQYFTSQPTVKVTDPFGNSREVKTDLLKAQVMSDKDALGRITSYLYDSFGRRTRITYPEGNYVQITYDGRGNVTELRRVAKPGAALADIVESASYPTTCSNPKTCNKPASTTDARGQTTDYTYDPTHGGVLTITQPAPFSGGVRPQTRFTYTALYAWYKNSAGSIVQAPTPIYKLTQTSACRTTSSCANSADEVRTTFAYQTGSSSTASNLLLTSVTQSAGDGSVSSVTTMSYDDRGNRTAVDGPLAGTVDTITTRYDILRRVVGMLGPDPDGSGPLLRRAVRTTYNADDLPTAVDRGTVNGTSDTDWAAFSQLEQMSIGYDAAGRRSSVAIVGGGTTSALTQFSYDAAGRLDCAAHRLNPAAFGSLSSVSACTPGAAGSFGPDRIAKTFYDAMGRVSKVQTGYGTSAPRDEISTTYSDNGNARTVTDARGNVTTYEYDRFDRLYRTIYPGTQDFEQFTYDAAGNVIEKRLRDGQVIVLAYDGLSRLQTRNLPGAELDVSYGYDNLGHAISVAQSGHTLQFGYDSLGRLRTQSGPHGTLTSTFDAAGRRTRLTWPDAFFVDYDYLLTGELTAVKENGAASGLGLLATYAYDNLGRRTALTRGNGTTTGYHYDNISRLDQLTQNLAATAADQTIGMSYSPAGQISTRTSANDAYAWTDNQPFTRNYAVDSLNRYTAIGAVVPTYDGRGNLTNSGAGAYTYSAENMLTSAPGGVSLTYDPLGRLYQTTAASGTTRFAYDGDQLVSEYNASSQLLRRYVRGGSVDEPLVWYEGSGTGARRWLHTDERGSVVAISDASGAQFAINRYDEHGVPAATNVGRFQFTGQAWIAEAQLYYFKARFYSASLGRFMQTDPTGYGAGMNMYAYVRGDALNRRDPSGLDDLIIGEVTVSASRWADWEREVEFMLNLMKTWWDDRLAFAIQQPANAQASTAQAEQKCGEHTWLPQGGGLMAAGGLDVGAMFTGVGGQGGVGAGIFHSSTTGWSAGHFASTGTASYVGSSVSGIPSQDSQPRIIGASVGGGVYGFVTNAQSVNQLSGHFQSYSANIGVGPWQASFNVAYGGGIWQLSISPPIAGVTAGLSLSEITTDTETSGHGCR